MGKLIAAALIAGAVLAGCGPTGTTGTTANRYTVSPTVGLTATGAA